MVIVVAVAVVVVVVVVVVLVVVVVVVLVVVVVVVLVEILSALGGSMGRPRSHEAGHPAALWAMRPGTRRLCER